MKNINLLIFIFSLVLIQNFAHADSSESVKKGIEAYNQGKYEDAMKNFIDAQLERPELPELYYNIGSAAYKKQEYETALNNFTKSKEALKESKDKDADLLREKSIFNLGNTNYKMGKLEDAVKEFEAIPKTSQLYNDAKENIEFVKKKIEEQKKQEQDKQNQENKDKQNQENKDKQNQENKDKQNQENKDKQNQENKDKQNQENKEKQNQENKDKQNQENKDKQNQENKDKQNQENKDKQNQENKEKEEQQQQNINQEEQKTEEQNTEKAEQGEQKGETAGKGENKQSREHLLNRLEDKAGSALMPEYREQQVLKDW